MIIQSPVISIPLEDKITALTIRNDLGVFISDIASLILVIAGIAVFFYLLFAGFTWISAGNDKGKLDEAKNMITNAIIGLAIVATSWAIFIILNLFFGIGIETGAGDSIPAGFRIGGGSGSGGAGGGTGTPTNGQCGCYNGGCVSNGEIGALTYNGDCYVCTDGQWIPNGASGTGSCPAIQCGVCGE